MIPPPDAAALLARALGLRKDQTPFPWQFGLLERFRKDDIPSAIDVPTGLGKTGVMAVWLVARALAPRVPRRLVYVVDRRAVVDQATREAERLRDVVEADPEFKARIGLNGNALPVSTLRGQFLGNKDWMKDPVSPAIVVGTVDMIGSRLLFEGYGVSRNMRGYHAGLLGADALLVIDEAHLVPPFRKLVENISRSRAVVGLRPSAGEIVPPFRVVAMSATGGDVDGGTILHLSDEDEHHTEARLRLDAKKSIEISSPGADDLVKALANEAWKIAENETPSRIVVYCHSHKDAKAIAADLKKRGNSKKGEPNNVELLVGARRVRERERVDAWLAEHGYFRPRDSDVTAPFAASSFLVANAAGEVGVDLDAEHMVLDVVAWERMVQRLGRVNRFGRGDARIVVVPGKKPKKNAKKVVKEGAEREEKDAEEERRASVLEILGKLPKKEGSFDGSPKALRGLVESEDTDVSRLIRAATTPPPMRPPLTRALVDAWSMTSLKEHTGRPDVQPWLRGWVAEDAHTRIAWRQHLPTKETRDGIAASLPDREVDSFYEAAPPHLSEILEAETWQVVDWLGKRSKKRWREDQILDGTPNARPLIDDIVGLVLSPADELVRTVTGRALQQKRELDALETSLAGHTLVLHAQFAGLSEDGLLDEGVEDPPLTIEDEAWDRRPFRIHSTTADQTPETGADWVEELRIVTESDDEGEPRRFLIVEAPRDRPTTEDARSAGGLQRLGEHSEWTENCAERIARALGLPDDLARALKLAARLHDNGKSAPAWQEAFRAPADGGPYAKTSTTGIDQSRLGGYRHELGSLLAAEKHAEVKALDEPLRDLVLHLIASHHGRARPLMPTRGVEYLPPSALQDKATEIALRFARLQKEWGPWGLAWLESLLRAADHQASAMNGERAEGA